MAIEIPWIGYGYQLKYHMKSINEMKDYACVPLFTASEGLEFLKQEKCPIVIVQEGLHYGEIEIPSDCINVNDFTKYFLIMVRELPDYKKTPILIPHFSYPEEVSPYSSLDNLVIPLSLFSKEHSYFANKVKKILDGDLL